MIYIILSALFHSTKFFVLYENVLEKLQKEISPALLEGTNEEPETGQSGTGKPASQQLATSDLFKNATMRKNILIMFVNWIVITLGRDAFLLK